jgi:acetate kinase
VSFFESLAFAPSCKRAFTLGGTENKCINMFPAAENVVTIDTSFYQLQNKETNLGRF